MHFGTFYRPADTGFEDLDKLEASLSRFAHKETGNINTCKIF